VPEHLVDHDVDRPYGVEAHQLQADAEPLGHAQQDAVAGSGSVVAYLDGVAVGCGGLSLVDGVARLWGGAVREDARSRGAYRAVLDARLRRGLERGVTMALVKGRIQTSGPILRRAGFEVYGQERSYLVPL
jgi:GNAT superfamily N-acetyltransferase